MDVAGKDTILETEKGIEDPGNYHASNLSSDWQVNGNSLTNTSIRMIQMGNSMVESSACSSTSMVDSFCPPIWDQPVNGQNLDYSDVNVQNAASTFSSLASVRANIGWTPNQMSRGGMFLPAVHGMLPQSLSHFPADSAFIERAARFSSFSGGNFGEMMSSFSVPDPLNPYSQGLASIQGPREVLGGDGSKSFRGLQSHRYEMNLADGSNEASFVVEHGTEVNPLKNKEKGRNFLWSCDEAKHGPDVSANESDEAEVNSRSQEKLEGAAGKAFGKGLGSKKRKRILQNIEQNENNEAPQPSIETEKDHAEIKQKDTEIKQKGDHNTTSTSKAGGKYGKQGSQVSDTPKEEYIHVRARRGQATNSHSLAERVRREKISERMKYLQDLVPGCSKVTGKAVMLDEIINYVQSLQRQVERKTSTFGERAEESTACLCGPMYCGIEFLSMKLATVNHRVDFNIEEFLAKDILQPRAGLSSSLAFPPDMTLPYPPLHLSQAGLTQASIPGLGNSSYAIGRAINLQSTAVGGGFNEPTSQVPSTWEDELRDVVHMGFNSSSPIDRQDLSDSLPLGPMKAEP